MEPVDFRNLIGRVGRISFNLFGNVYFVSEEAEKVESDDYVRMLQEKVPGAGAFHYNKSESPQKG